MKINKIVDRIERALWQTGRSLKTVAGAPVVTGGPDWQDRVMADIRLLGPLDMKSPAGIYKPAIAWSWAAAAAACLAIALGWYAFIGLNTDTVLTSLFLDDPAGWTVDMVLAEM